MREEIVLETIGLKKYFKKVRTVNGVSLFRKPINNIEG